MMLPPCAVLSPSRAAGMPPMSTVPLPLTTRSGGPAQVSMSPSLSAGMPPISTVGPPGGNAGPPTCGPAGVTIGHTCMSLTRAAGGIVGQPSSVDHHDRPFEGQGAAAGYLDLGAALGGQRGLGFHLHLQGLGLEVGLRFQLHGLLGGFDLDAVAVQRDLVAAL